MLSYNITENFMSVQSEGSQAGMSAFFMRFHGCNLTCEFGNGFVCDEVLHTQPNFKEYTPLELVILARKAKAHNIVITGGEPSNHKDIGSLIRFMRHEGYHVAVETNGNHIERLLDANLITYSPKVGYSKGARMISHEDYQDLSSQLPEIELKLLAGVHKPVPDHIWDSYPLKYVQAINNQDSLDLENIRYVSDFVSTHLEWYMSFQTHKVTGAR